MVNARRETRVARGGLPPHHFLIPRNKAERAGSDRGRPPRRKAANAVKCNACPRDSVRTSVPSPSPIAVLHQLQFRAAVARARAHRYANVLSRKAAILGHGGSARDTQQEHHARPSQVPNSHLLFLFSARESIPALLSIHIGENSLSFSLAAVCEVWVGKEIRSGSPLANAGNAATPAVCQKTDAALTSATTTRKQFRVIAHKCRCWFTRIHPGWHASQKSAVARSTANVDRCRKF
jgi:hypothetical protein